MRALWTVTPFIITATTGLLGPKYLGIMTFPYIISTNLPITWIMEGSLFFILGFLRHASLIALLYIGTSWISLNKGILTHTCLRWSRKSKAGSSLNLDWASLWGNGGSGLLVGSLGRVGLVSIWSSSSLDN